MAVSFTRGGYAALWPELVAALSNLGTTHGIQFTVEGGTIGSASLIFKVVAKSADPAEREALERRKFALMSRAVDLEPDDYGLEFVSHSGAFKIVGIKSGRPKYPLQVIQVRTGKAFKYTRLSPTVLADARARRDAAKRISQVTAQPQQHSAPASFDPAFSDWAQF